jgi:hypothetical protein
MHPNSRLSLSLLGALVLWIPSFQATISGNLDLLGAAIRFAVAFLALQFALGILSHLWLTYRVTSTAAAVQSGQATGETHGLDQTAGTADADHS